MGREDGREHAFHEVSKSVFVRKCYGLEELVSNMEEYCDGFTHLTITAAVSLPSFTTQELEERVKNAWVAFRHFTPAIACKTFRLSDGDRRFAFRYVVPRSEEDVQAWLGETLFFSDKNEDKSLYEKHRELKDSRWWRCSDDHYVLELHVSPMVNDWAFSLVFSHNSIDGRNAYAMLDLFLKFLARELEDGPDGPSTSLNIEWGTEVMRLPPPGAFAAALAESEAPPDIAGRKPKPTVNGVIVPKVTHWLYPTRSTNETGDVSRLVQFPEDTSEKLHVLCRKKGRTITHAVTALTALAHAEAALKTAGRSGAQRFAEVVGSYNAASHYLVPWNFINQRHKFPGGYNSYESPTSTALSTADCVPLSFPMDGIRRCIKVDEDNRSALRMLDEEAFWDVLVRDVAEAWKAIDQSLDGYAAREGALHRAFDAFTPQLFDLPALIVSSIGDLGRLGVLSSFLPPTKNELRPNLVVQDVVCGIRVRTPPIMNLFWEYRGRLTCHFMSGGEYTTADELALVTGIFEEWTQTVVRWSSY